MKKVRTILVIFNALGVLFFCALGLFIGVQQVGRSFSLYHELGDLGIINLEVAVEKKYDVKKKLERACIPSGLDLLVGVGVALCLANAIAICLQRQSGKNPGSDSGSVPAVLRQ